MPIARWSGTLNVVGLEVPCCVLDNGQKIIGRTSATELLTGIKGGGAPEKYIPLKALEAGWKEHLHSRPKWWGRLVIEMIYETKDPDIAKYPKNNKPQQGPIGIDN